MDLFDLAQGFPSLRAALADYSPRVLMVGISSDFLFPPHQQKEIVRALRAGKKSAVYREIISPYGHDAFLIEFDQLGYIIEEFLLKT
jgi:homoserine O-acetyltransferase